MFTTRKSPSYTIKDDQNETKGDKFHQKALIIDRSHLTLKSFTKKLVCNASAKLLPHNTLNSFTIFFAGVTESRGAMGGCNFGIILLISVSNCYRENNFVFWHKIFKFVRIFDLERGLYHSITDSVEGMNTVTQQRHNLTENFIVVKTSW